MGGNFSVNQPGTYGEQGNASTSNFPGARRGAFACYDSTHQQLWVFGGFGYTDGTSNESTCFNKFYLMITKKRKKEKKN